MAAIAVARAYRHSFDTRPNTTLAIAGGALTALGDIVAQVAQNVRARRELHHNRPEFDVKRTLRFFVYGAAMSPLIGRWNGFLEWRFPLRSEGGRISMLSLGKRVAADQIIMAPIGLTAFLGSMGVMEGRDLNHIKGKFRDLYREALIANWKVWPAVQFINFRFMPLAYRVPFQQTCGVFWTLYLSLLNSTEARQQDLRDDLRRTLE